MGETAVRISKFIVYDDSYFRVFLVRSRRGIPAPPVSACKGTNKRAKYKVYTLKFLSEWEYLNDFSRKGTNKRAKYKAQRAKTRENTRISFVERGRASMHIKVLL
jgi:hypothetical protein